MHNTSGIANTVGKTAAGADLVQSYLDSLLRDVTLDLEPEELLAASPAPVAEVARPVVETPTPPLQVAPRQVAPKPVVESHTIHSPVIATLDSEENVALLSPSVPADELLDTAHVPLMAVELDPKTERVIPDWARQGFAGLLFEVAGLKMVAPLHALGGISLIEDRLQPVVGQADWFMGLLRWNGRNLRVVDTARFVMPERLESNAHHSAYQSVIVLGDSHWALAVDCADESVNLKADEIRWKQLTGVRPWLAGTVLQRLCALLDVDNLMSMLQQHEQQVRESLGPDIRN